MRIVTRGGWDDFFYWTDDLADARRLIARDPHAVMQNHFPDIARPPASRYQIVDLTTGDLVSNVQDETDR